ncbi:alpha/beta hydrolase [Cellulomonas sp. C5510]|uniref:alpha/beta hydrolase n=1 Tax=Cellulomonas sp. C5510 TaxID=2871170 RepID=UPI001C95D5EA|nr:alpha/beta hydrolase [Cellulomonas sp. C5510]QZN85770.1 alpha/beta hydrolase family protein [Cellulomonas sp. C5510]
MTALDTVLAWRPDAVAGLADHLAGCRRLLVTLDDDLDAAAPPATWAGPSRDAALRAHDALRRRLATTVAEIALVAVSADDAAASLTTARAELDATLAWARAHGYHVDHGTGRATDARCVADDDEARDRALTARELTDRVQQALRTAQHADTLLADALRRAADTDDPLPAAGLAAAGHAGAARGRHRLLRPPGGTPADAAAWWRSLTPEHQARVLARHPEWVGNLDGIPFAVRDQANRVLLDRYRDELTAQREALLADADSWDADTAGILIVLDEKLAGLEAIERALATSGDRRLLLLDTTGDHQLKAAVGVGDVDSAAHVGVFVPGFTTTVSGNLEDHVVSMEDLASRARAESRAHGDQGGVATVAWLGYEAPQWSDVTDPTGRFVTSDTLARQGGEDLARFLQGVDAARDFEHPRLTALGHSYGSTTTGFAMREETGLDAAVVFGSPGLATSSAESLDVPAGSLYRVEARLDPVADAGHFGVDPSHLRGVTGLSSRAGEVGGVPYEASTGHSDYLRDNTMSQHNIASVVVGLTDRAVLHSGVGAGDFVSHLRAVTS